MRILGSCTLQSQRGLTSSVQTAFDRAGNYRRLVSHRGSRHQPALRLLVAPQGPGGGQGHAGHAEGSDAGSHRAPGTLFVSDVHTQCTLSARGAGAPIQASTRSFGGPPCCTHGFVHCVQFSRAGPICKDHHLHVNLGAHKRKRTLNWRDPRVLAEDLLSLSPASTSWKRDHELSTIALGTSTWKLKYPFSVLRYLIRRRTEERCMNCI